MSDALETRPTPKHDALEPLLREVLGRRLRSLRLRRGETLVATASRAGISPQYLSEVERGLKEASSEMIAAITGALGITLVDLTWAVLRDLRGDGGVRSLHAVASVTSLASTASASGFTLYAVAA